MIFEFHNFQIDTERRLLLDRGTAVSLNPKAFDLLLTLVERRGDILSKNYLLDSVWKGQFVEENNLTVHISALRKILGEQKGENRFIITVPGEGYKFIAELSENENDEIIIENHKIKRIIVDEEIETEELQAKLPPANFSKTVPVLLLIGLLIFVSLGVWFFYDRSTASSIPINSIAVMPFIYEGGSAETEYLSDGITESLINNLSQLPKLSVKARASVFQYKGKEFDLKKIGKDLTVQAILLGRIIERGDDFDISLELIDPNTGNHLWGERYSRKKSDLAILQTVIARDVSAKLHQKFAENKTPPTGQTANAEAYQLYLKGRYLWNKRRHEDHLKAINAFEQAIALDPNFALAYAALGDVYTVDSFKGSPEERTAKGRAAAMKALEIEPNLAEAYTILAKVEWDHLNRAESEAHFKRAIALNPNYASARQWYAEFLIQEVRIEEAISEIRIALYLDPLSSVINSDAVYIHVMARQDDNAIAQANKLLEFDPNWSSVYEWRGAAYESKGDFTAALDDFEKSNELSNKSEDLKQLARKDYRRLREALLRSGRQGYWEKSLEIMKELPVSERDNFFTAIAFAQLGDKKNALDALEQAFDDKNRQINLIKVEPYFEEIRSEPRFQALLRRINL